jgi:hypothetical protein
MTFPLFPKPVGPEEEHLDYKKTSLGSTRKQFEEPAYFTTVYIVKVEKCEPIRQ